MAENSSTLQANDSKDHLECSVCMELFDTETRHPRVLTCGHTFCHLCLGDIRRGATISCPLCSQQTVIQSGNVQDISKNFALIDMLMTLCQHCSSQWTDKCKACNQKLCGSCSELHKDRHRLQQTLGEITADQTKLFKQEEDRLRVLHNELEDKKQEIKRFFDAHANISLTELKNKLLTEVTKAKETGSLNFDIWKAEFSREQQNSVEDVKDKLRDLQQSSCKSTSTKNSLEEIQFQCDLLRVQLESYQPNSNLAPDVDLLSSMLRADNVRPTRRSRDLLRRYGTWDKAMMGVGLCAFIIAIGGPVGLVFVILALCITCVMVVATANNR